MFFYSQTTGQLTRENGCALGAGYAGNGAGLNDPAFEQVRNEGPLPRGVYAIGEPHDDVHTGRFTLDLEPDAGNAMFGRALFRIHGDNERMNHTASDGCIVMPLTVRLALAHAIRLGAENKLTVTT